MSTIKRRLVRSPNTPVVHRDTCPTTMRPGSAFKPWKWADEVNDDLLRQALRASWNRPCKQCIPGGANTI